MSVSFRGPEIVASSSTSRCVARDPVGLADVPGLGLSPASSGAGAAGMQACCAWSCVLAAGRVAASSGPWPVAEGGNGPGDNGSRPGPVTDSRCRGGELTEA